MNTHRKAAIAALSGSLACVEPAYGVDAELVPSNAALNRNTKVSSMSQPNTDQNKYVGMWVTADGYIRHELLPTGRYDEARGKHRSAYQGRYTLTGDHIDYVDDTGFSADGDFRDGILYHAGMVLHRQTNGTAQP